MILEPVAILTAPDFPYYSAETARNKAIMFDWNKDNGKSYKEIMLKIMEAADSGALHLDYPGKISDVTQYLLTQDKYTVKIHPHYAYNVDAHYRITWNDINL